MAQTAIAKEFIRVAFVEKPQAKRVLLNIANNILPSQNNKRLRDIDDIFDVVDIENIVDTIRMIDRYKVDYFDESMPFPEEIYEYLLQYPFIVNFPDMKKFMSRRAQEISEELDEYFSNNQSIGLLSSLPVTFAALIRSYCDMLDLHYFVKLNIGTENHDMCLKKADAVMQVATKLASSSTTLEGELRNMIQETDVMFTLYDQPYFWYISFAQKNIGMKDKVCLSFFEQINLPKCFTPILQEAYLKLAEELHEKYNFDPVDTFHYFAINAILPAQEYCSSVQPIEELGIETSLFYDIYSRGELKKFCEINFPEVIKFWNLHDEGNANPSELSPEISRQIQMAKSSIMVVRMAGEVTRMEGRHQMALSETDLIELEQLVKQTPRDFYGYPPMFIASILEMHATAVECYNGKASIHDFERIEYSGECGVNDNDSPSP